MLAILFPNLLPSLRLPQRPLSHGRHAAHGVHASAADQWTEPEFDKQPLESQFAAAVFQRPSTGEELRRFLVGNWTVRKVTTYKRGGISGRFEGQAEFAELLPKVESSIHYQESGIFRPTGDQLPSSSREPMDTRNQLVYEFAAPARVDIYYYESNATSATQQPALPAEMQFMHSLSLDTMLLTEHQDGPNTYRGNVDIEARNAFLTTWDVTGPTTEGTVLTLYNRVL